MYAYEVKPRVKRFGLFRGRIYVDVFKGSLVRAEGTAVKLASFFLKKAEFVQDYADFGKFTFPVHLHSEVRARFIGHAVVDVYERDYQAVSATGNNGLPTTGMEPISSLTGLEIAVAVPLRYSPSFARPFFAGWAWIESALA